MKDKVIEEMKLAMKSKNRERLNIMRLMNAKITEYQKENSESSDDKLITVLDAMVKERKKVVDIYLKANETERANSELYEISVIEEFLPKRMSINEITTIVQNIIDASGAHTMKDMGKVMGAAKMEIGTNANPSDLAMVIKKLLS